MVVFAIPPVQTNTLQEKLFSDRVSGGEFLGDSLEVDWPIGECRCVAVDVVGDSQFGVDFYGAKQFFVVAEPVHVDAHLTRLYDVDSLDTSVSQSFVRREQSFL
jgi:hypothetical protein